LFFTRSEIYFLRNAFFGYYRIMYELTRITFDPELMGGKPCIRGMRVTVGTLVGLVASGLSFADILNAYPYLEEEDLREALAYAAWRVEEIEAPLAPA
jgi:uncharacterized protein (DUF433 family)